MLLKVDISGWHCVQYCLLFFQNFSVCQKCSRIGALFHRLHHQKHRMFSTCVEVVEGRRKANPALDTTKILNELLANDKWLEQVQQLSSELILKLGSLGYNNFA